VSSLESELFQFAANDNMGSLNLESEYTNGMGPATTSEHARAAVGLC
jgi:hypothetical protein